MGDDRRPKQRRSRDIDARDARGVQFGDYNIQYNTFGPVVRSAYLAEVRRLAPAKLLDRDDELAQLAAFARGGGPPAYQRWDASAEYGMTALLAWFVLHPPPGVRVVSYFVPAGHSERTNRDAFIDVVLEQLVELTDRSMPGHLTGATRKAHLLNRYTEAAEACARRGERLLLVVEGLDDRRNVSGVVRLLPDRLVAGMRVLLGTSGLWRPPTDLPSHHPLRTVGRSTYLPPYVSPEEKLEREAEKAEWERGHDRREAERQRADEARRDAQRQVDEWRRAEAVRTSPAARTAAVKRALVFVAGWTGALVLLSWLAWAWHDTRVAGILTAQILAGGVGATLRLAPAAFRLGAAYAPSPRTPGSWLPSPRAMVIRGCAVLVVLCLFGAGAADYLDAHDDRMVEKSIGRAGSLPSFTEAVALLFLVLMTLGCAVAGLYLGASVAGTRQKRYQAGLRAYQAATEREAYAGISADVLSSKPAVRAQAYQDFLARLSGRPPRRPPR
ncbi:hypothetical protein [Micromonospora sp. AKA38]|uniref:hypothetical protein n=1 Tax=Micromonospora sp. AKA38 TaxID=2733861 RepID=UPI0022BBEB92|nr:hypothetical protein [Micromonospora sp. AKA38]GHJ12989.1 hypothetical protein TPA0908_09840 [Micromonospora sp. AKA38]